MSLPVTQEISLPALTSMQIDMDTVKKQLHELKESHNLINVKKSLHYIHYILHNFIIYKISKK